MTIVANATVATVTDDGRSFDPFEVLATIVQASKSSGGTVISQLAGAGREIDAGFESIVSVSAVFGAADDVETFRKLVTEYAGNDLGQRGIGWLTSDALASWVSV